jgi:hypothetical protein
MLAMPTVPSPPHAQTIRQIGTTKAAVIAKR